jgi:hypothetical protein
MTGSVAEPTEIVFAEATACAFIGKTNTLRHNPVRIRGTILLNIYINIISNPKGQCRE